MIATFIIAVAAAASAPVPIASCYQAGSRGGLQHPEPYQPTLTICRPAPAASAASAASAPKG